MKGSSLNVIQLNKTINGNHVLNNISFSVEKGTTCGFIGRNASGKSMLFKVVCGIIRKDSGTISVFGRENNKGDFIEDTGVLIEQPGFLPRYSGFKNLLLLSQINKKVDENHIIKVMEEVGLEPADHRPFQKYSLGMRQKLGIAQAIMEKPAIIILDEPMNNLDQESIGNIRRIIMRLKKQGATILLSSHIEDDIKMLCDKVYTITNGKILDETEKGYAI